MLSRREAGQLLLGVGGLVQVAAAQSPPAVVEPRPAAVPTRLPGPPRWRIQFFHDEDRSSLLLRDLAFPSPQRGIATGTLFERGRKKEVAIVTSDGGKTWPVTPLPAEGRTLFFLNDSVGWMVASNGIWKTLESGRAWKRITKRDNLARVWFANEQRGWAVGYPKTFLQTRDGGATWQKVPEGDAPATRAENTTYRAIEFVNPRVGAVLGVSRPLRWGQSRLPAWMDAEDHSYARELPGTTVFLSTSDGGETWASNTAAAFGTPVRLRMSPRGLGLSLYRFEGRFPFTSELYRIDLRTGKSTSVLRTRDYTLTDIGFAPDGTAYAVGVQRTSMVADSPVPGAVHVLRSMDLLAWEEMDVDYKAYGSRAFLSVLDRDQAWVGTDAGMLLRLQPSS